MFESFLLQQNNVRERRRMEINFILLHAEEEIARNIEQRLNRQINNQRQNIFRSRLENRTPVSRAVNAPIVVTEPERTFTRIRRFNIN